MIIRVLSLILWIKLNDNICYSGYFKLLCF